MYQNIYYIKNTNGTTTNSGVSPSQQCFLYDKNAPSFKSSLSEGFPFRGFPESETSTLQCQLCNPNSVSYINLQQRQFDFSNRQLGNNSQKWLDNYNSGQMSHRQYMLNKKCAPVRINTDNESHLCYSSRTVYQDTCNRTDTSTNLWDNKIFSLLNNTVKENCKEIYLDDTNVISDKNKKFDILRTILDNRQNATVKQISDDIRKMDVCGDGDQDVVVDADDLLATADDKLKTSLKNFLKRAQEGISIEQPAFPRTKMYPQAGSLNLIYFTSKDRKPEIAKREVILDRDLTSDASRGEAANSMRSRNIISEMKRRISNERTKQEAYARANKLQTKCDSQKFSRTNELQRNIVDYVTGNEAVENKLERKGSNAEESMHSFSFRYKIMGSSLNNVINPENTFQALSTSQLVAYKKQYYDTLNVQRAKVAVTNSLASSDNLTVCDNAYCSNYKCRRQHLLHQQRRFATRPPYPTSLSGLSDLRSNQYSWARSDCKYLLLKQLRLQQTSPLYSRNRRYVFHLN
ncbi:uncharacterized protein LOC109856385 isoform X3 [Pseudomyrmex gracilis]|uniref:uncharacterized protein LOC109856385 isoform X3 n=1 Tax=Pseudomyrmex gracilis TaxID=219809 RepID=UPI000995AED7|nr:uncharacterized protein LOC109856385 isoform X3 [Pseudomyrmex gracilis]